MRKIIKALWELRSLSLSSQRGYSQKIKFLSRKTNLDNSKAAESFILTMQGAGKYKQTLLSAYFYYCKANNIVWVPPRIKARSLPIVVPTEERIDKIISAGLQKWITVFSISKHGLRPDEIYFYYNPGRFHPLYDRLLKEVKVKPRITKFTHKGEIR